MRLMISSLRCPSVLLLLLTTAACRGQDEADTGHQSGIPADSSVTVQQEGEYRITVITDTGEEETVTLAAFPKPPNAPTCPRGKNVGRPPKVVGANGDTLQLNPPQAERTTIYEVLPLASAPAQAFHLFELGETHPEVNATGPAQSERYVRITMRWEACTWPAGYSDDDAWIFYRQGNQWVPLEPAFALQRRGDREFELTVELDSVSSRFAVGAN